METRQRGVTLIEAMVSLVVLAIGLLGLVQLQAQLWSTSGDVHSTEKAYLLAGNSLEKSVIAEMMAVDLIADTSAQPAVSLTAFTVDPALIRQEQLAEARVRIDWKHPSGLRSLSLDTAIYTDFRASDSRLLLPAD